MTCRELCPAFFCGASVFFSGLAAAQTTKALNVSRRSKPREMRMPNQRRIRPWSAHAGGHGSGQNDQKKIGSGCLESPKLGEDQVPTHPPVTLSPGTFQHKTSRTPPRCTWRRTMQHEDRTPVSVFLTRRHSGARVLGSTVE